MTSLNDIKRPLDKIEQIRRNIKNGYYTPVAMTLEDIETSILDEIKKVLLGCVSKE